MKKTNLYLILISLTISFALSYAEAVPLYGVFETQVTNNKSYSNPFDYNVIELQAVFTAPNGTKTNFFGFYDGDGNGGQTGIVWKLRFMPNQVGTYSYTYTWTDGTPGGSGSFSVSDTGLPGPLKVATDNSWYFMNARNEPFHYRGCGLQFWHKIRANTFRSFVDSLSEYKAAIQRDIDNEKCNFIYIWGSDDRDQRSTEVDESWWLSRNDSDVRKFKIPVWKAHENLLHYLKDQKVYAMPWHVFGNQWDYKNFNDKKVLLRYWVARMSSFYNWNGWSLTWEWPETLTEGQVTQVMAQVKAWNPFPTLLTAHDSARESFKDWMGFAARQCQARTVFVGRTCGQHGGTQGRFVDLPIIGSEDIWENSEGHFGQPRNETEVRRAAWGAMLSGVMPMYTEWHTTVVSSWGNGEGKDDVTRMFDFFYTKTNYRKYQHMHDLVSWEGRQRAAGNPGQEYLVYDENGGNIIIDLSGTNNSFSVLFYDPINDITKPGGTIQGGATRTLPSPFGGDTVLLLKNSDADNIAPRAPASLSIL